jgi:hypothetical protein
MEILCFVMGNLLEYGHHKFEIVLRHDDGGGEVGLLSFSLGAPLGMARPRGDSTLSAGALAARLLVVLVQPLLIALVHVVNEPIVESVGNRLFNGARPTKVSAGILPVVRRVGLFVVVN